MAEDNGHFQKAMEDLAKGLMPPAQYELFGASGTDNFYHDLLNTFQGRPVVPEAFKEMYLKIQETVLERMRAIEKQFPKLVQEAKGGDAPAPVQPRLIGTRQEVLGISQEAYSELGRRAMDQVDKEFDLPRSTEAESSGKLVLDHMYMVLFVKGYAESFNQVVNQLVQQAGGRIVVVPVWSE